MYCSKYLPIFSLATILVVGCESSFDDDQHWGEFLQKIGVHQDEILCEGRQNEDRFLIALNDGKLLTAYQIFLPATNGKIYPAVMSWSFQNENGVGLEGDFAPEIILKEVVKYKGKLYRERADYRHLTLEDSTEIEVRFGALKDRSGDQIPKEGPYDLRNLDSKLVCTLPVSELNLISLGV